MVFSERKLAIFKTKIEEILGISAIEIVKYICEFLDEKSLRLRVSAVKVSSECLQLTIKVKVDGVWHLLYLKTKGLFEGDVRALIYKECKKGQCDVLPLQSQANASSICNMVKFSILEMLGLIDRKDMISPIFVSQPIVDPNT